MANRHRSIAGQRKFASDCRSRAFAERVHRSAVAIACLWIGCLAALIARADDPPETVGEWGDSDRIEIAGVSHASTDLLLAAIRADVKTQVAAAAESPLLDYLDALRHRVITAEEHIGFPEVQVACRRDSFRGKIVLQIDEGPCCYCDSIHVEGAKRVPVDDLIRMCREKRPPSAAILSGFDRVNEKTVPHWVNKDGEDVSQDESIWEKGTEASFDVASKGRYQKKLSRCFTDLGFPAADFEIEIRPDTGAKTAALLIRIAKEGAGPIIRRVEIVGNKVNSTQAILDFAGIRVGNPYSAERAAEWQQRLWKSGRFMRHEVSVFPCDSDSSGLTLRVEVVELKKAPPLNQPLSPEEAAMLKCREWLADAPKRGDDLVITLSPTPGDRVPIIVVSRDGVLASLSDLTPDVDALPRVRQALVARQGNIAYYSLDARKRFAVQPSADFQVVCTLDLKLKDDVDQQETLGFYFGCRNNSGESNKLPLDLAVGGAPAAFLRMLYRDDVKTTLAKGSLKLVIEDGEEWEIDSNTGMFHITSKRDAEATTFAPGLTFRHGAFEKLRRQIESEGANFPNEFDPHHPATSAFAVIFESDLHQSLAGKSALDRKFLGACRKLLANSALKPLDEELWNAMLGTAIDQVLNSPTDEWDWGRVYTATLFTASDRLFPRGTWPWSSARGLAFSIAQEDIGERQLTTLIESGTAGPLCHLCLAATSDMINWKASQVFARRGADRLSLTDFRNDYRPLLDQRSLLGKQILALAGALRRLTSDDVESLCKDLAPDDARMVRDAAAELRASGNAPLQEVLPKVLDHAWGNGLQRKVEKALQAMAAG